MPLDNEDSTTSHEVSKRLRNGAETLLTLPVQSNDFGRDGNFINGLAPDLPKMDCGLNPVEKMIAVIGALLAEGDKGAESLEILVSKIHPDLLADIVITNMKHLPKMPPPLTRLGNLPVPRQMNSLSSSGQVVSGSPPRNSVQSPTIPSQMPLSSATVTSTLVPDVPTANNLPIDSKRDPRRVFN